MTVQLVSKISNLCDPDPPTLQTDIRTDERTDGQTDGQHAISIPRYALVHRAVKSAAIAVVVIADRAKFAIATDRCLVSMSVSLFMV